MIVSRRRRHFNYCLVTEARPIVAVRRMALPGQSLLLWSVLVVALASCAGRGEIIGPGQGGTSGTSSGGSGGSVGGCGTGQAKCGSECKDLNADQLNCGACGNACGSGQTCQAGQCQCTAGLLGCNGACIPADASNCGSCNNKCASGQVCSSNSCQSSCGGGETQCSGGACVDTMSNALNCGTCGNACPAGSVCNGGVCGCSAAGPDAVLERVRRHDDQQRPLRRLQPGLQRHVRERRVRQHAGRRGAAAAEHPAHDQRRVRRLRAGAARHDHGAERERSRPTRASGGGFT